MNNNDIHDHVHHFRYQKHIFHYPINQKNFPWEKNILMILENPENKLMQPHIAYCCEIICAYIFTIVYVY